MLHLENFFEKSFALLLTTPTPMDLEQRDVYRMQSNSALPV